ATVITLTTKLIDKWKPVTVLPDLTSIIGKVKLSSRYTVIPVKALLQTFILNQFDNTSFRIHFLALLLQRLQCLGINVFDFDREDVACETEVQHSIVIGKCSAGDLRQRGTGRPRVRVDHSERCVEVKPRLNEHTPKLPASQDA